MMKKKTAIALAAVSFLSLAAFAACGEGENGGENGNTHTSHVWSAWSVTKNPTCTEKGERSRSCACGETEKQEIDENGHSWEQTLSVNAEKHWTECSVCHEKKDEVAHAFTGMKYDGFRHWKVCADCDTPETNAGEPVKAQHAMTDGKCTECDYEQKNFTEGLAYELKDDDTYKVTGIGTATGIDLIIPAFYEDKPVTEIDRFVFEKNHTIETLVVPDSVTTIGRWAFNGCDKLETVTLGSGITFIGNSTFEDTKIKRVNYTGDVKGWLGIEFENAGANPLCDVGIDHCNLYFNGERLTDVEVPEGITEIKPYAFYRCRGIIWTKMGAGVTKIGESAFAECTALSDVDFGTSSPDIGDKAFYRTAVRKVELTEGLTKIGQEAFNYCDKLETVAVPTGVQTLGMNAFSNCTLLHTASVGAAAIGTNAFSGCTRLQQVTFEEGVQSIGYNAFYNCGMLIDFDLPESLTEIGNGAFSGCENITKIKIPAAVKSIGNSAFMSCSNLTSLEIAGGETPLKIGDSVFYYCGLKAVTLPDRVTELGKEAFKSCAELESVKLGANLSKVGSEAFGNCKKLTELSIDDANTAFVLDGNCFIDKAAKKVIMGFDNSVIPTDGSVTAIGGKAFANCEFTEFTIPAQITSIENEAFRWCANLINITLPAEITAVPDWVFANCTSLESVEFLGNVVSIGMSSFNGCTSLGTVTLPETVTSIGNSAFSGCTNLELTVGENVTSVGIYAFSGCTKIQERDGALIYVGNWLVSYDPNEDLGNVTVREGTIGIVGGTFSACDSLTGIELPSTLTMIGDGAFSECDNLESIVIPDNVVTIGDQVFMKCANLKTVDRKSVV